MAIIRPGKSSRRRLSLEGAAVVRPFRGKTYVQSWPRKRGAPKQPWQKAHLELLRLSQYIVKRMPGEEIATMWQGLQNFLAKHTGVRGLAAIRLRDWLTQIPYGRAWFVEAPDGTRFYNAAALTDASDFLDWIEPTYGGVLIRTGDAWRTTRNCKAGNVLCCITDGTWPGACPPARLPTQAEAMGGH